MDLINLSWWFLLISRCSTIHIDISNAGKSVPFKEDESTTDKVCALDSVKAAAKIVVTDMLNYYYNNETGTIYSGIPGYLVIADYYWWECGAMFGALIDYWKYTGDTTFNSLAASGLQFQIGPQADFMPPNGMCPYKVHLHG